MRAPAERPTRCTAPGCEEPLRQGGRGRPPRYCSPACRAAAIGARTRLTVEIDHEPTAEHGRPTGRVWLVRLRHGTRAVVVASDLGRPSADHLAAQIADVLSPRRPTKGAAMG